MNFYIAFDTETGSINPKNGDLLTFYGAILDDNLRIVEELDLKLKPNDGRLPIAEAGALKVNGINLKEHLEDPATITYKEAHAKIMTMLRRYLKKNGRYSNIRPLGQNVQFDIDWTQEHVIPKDEWDATIHYAKIDTKLLVDFFKDCSYFPRDLGGLGSVVEYLGIPKRQSHTAKDDTLMCVDVYKKMIELMKSRKEGGSVQDLIALLEAE